MTQTSNRFYDQLAKLMNDAAGVAQGVGREARAMFRGQAERIVADMELVRREDFDAVRDMAAKAREENDRLQRRIEELEAKLEGMGLKSPGVTTTADAGDMGPGASSVRRSSRVKPKTDEGT